MHVVFTLPRRLAPLVLQNKKVIYDLLFSTSPKCGGPMKVIERLTAAEIQLRSPPLVTSAA